MLGEGGNCVLVSLHVLTNLFFLFCLNLNRPRLVIFSLLVFTNLVCLHL